MVNKHIDAPLPIYRSAYSVQDVEGVVRITDARRTWSSADLRWKEIVNRLCRYRRMDHVTRPIEILFNLQIFRFFYVSYIRMIRMIENLKSIWKRSSLNI